MTRLALAFALVVVVCAPSWANVYTVTHDGNVGLGSLESAIGLANGHLGADQIVFAAGMSGQTITPAAHLSNLTDDGTTINGDINTDGRPDIVIDGHLLPLERGLVITAGSCQVRGLVITGFGRGGIWVNGADNARIRGCHLGVNWAGTTEDSNGGHDIWLDGANDCIVGGAGATDRNIILGGATGATYGVAITGGSGNTVAGNYFGVRRDGTASLAPGYRGIIVNGIAAAAADNVIGGAAAGAGNLFAGLNYGVRLIAASATQVAGNTFGLGANGSTTISLVSSCVELNDGTTGTTIGGLVAGERNVFVSTDGTGVHILGAGTADNTVQGNYFGTNVAGTARRRLEQGIVIAGGAGAQAIGGNVGAARNYFTPSNLANTGVGVSIAGSSGITITRNTFGRLPNGVRVSGMMDAIALEDATATITRNIIYSALGAGVHATGAAANPAVYRNTFAHCARAVWVVTDARCRLGILGNLATSDDGLNVFDATNTMNISNDTPNVIRAEGNDFGTTSRVDIGARISDRLDDDALGLVDFDPLVGGVRPTAVAAALTLTGASAMATRSGAEVVFSLSAPAVVTVEIVNIAGRRVAVAARDQAAAAGTQRVLWNRRGAGGAPAPAGRYLARVTARTAEGGQVGAVCGFAVR